MQRSVTPGDVAVLMRLRRNRRRVVATLPLTEAYPAALGGRSELFEQWLTDPGPASPYWSSRDLTSATANLAIPVSLVIGWDDVMHRNSRPPRQQPPGSSPPTSRSSTTPKRPAS